MPLSVREAAEKWGVTQRTVHNWIEEGRIEAKRLADVLRANGLPPVGTDSYIIMTEERPPPSLMPIKRPKKPVVKKAKSMMSQPDDTSSQPEDQSTQPDAMPSQPVSGLWTWR